jgi:glycosyltransferase involved in cell wall biosynthesis
MKKKLSVLISVYNQEKYLAAALESVFKQGFKDFEALVVDDCSTDKSFSILKGFKDKRLKVFKNKKRQGLTKNLNFLLSKARGEYIARMDGDDICLKNRFFKQVKFLNKNKDYVLVGSFAKMIDKDGNVVGEFKRPVKSELIRENILKDNMFIHSSVMFRKREILGLGGYNEKFAYAQDYELFLRVVLKYKTANLPFYLLKFRWEPDFKKQKLQHKFALKARFNALAGFKMSRVKASYSKLEVFKLLKPLFFYLVPLSLKKAYWKIRL